MHKHILNWVVNIFSSYLQETDRFNAHLTESNIVSQEIKISTQKEMEEAQRMQERIKSIGGDVYKENKYNQRVLMISSAPEDEEILIVQILKDKKEEFKAIQNEIDSGLERASESCGEKMKTLYKAQKEQREIRVEKENSERIDMQLQIKENIEK